ncbi:MAG: lipoate--protein ligase family protein [Asgard group archaeon]|nr:lipoate--protein ligase family protein [Asgard group archaeon]
MKQATLRTKKGLIEVELDIENSQISSLKITGDFFIYPEEALEIIEKELLGIEINKEQLEDKIEGIYNQQEISTPGIAVDDWVKVILKAVNL